jgi:isoleucyl-tRNA synthetase
MLPLWNIYSFLVTYSQIHEWSPKDNLAYNSRVNEKDPSPWNHIPFSDVENELDAWILVLLQKTIKEVRAALDNYEIPRATRLIKELVDNLSKWYIRSNRDRFGDGDQSALETLYYVYIEILKLLAPFAPFVTEHIYRDLVAPHIADAPDSIHLCDYPESEEKFIDQYQSLEPEMDIIRKMCEMGQTLRTVNQLKVRQPLSKVEIKTTNPNVPALSQWMKDLIKKELNVKEVVEVIDAIETETKKKLEDTSIGVAMLLDTFIDPSLMEEGNVRELVRAIQATRKKLGLQQGEKVNIQFATSDSDLANIVEKYKEKISESVGAITIEKVDNLEDNNIQKVNGTDINLKIFK